MVLLHSGELGCTDYENWADQNGNGCDKYFSVMCKVSEQFANANDSVASSACCICGGGNREGN